MSNSSKVTDVHMITVILRVTPSDDNPPGRMFDLESLTKAISEVCSDLEVYVELDGAAGDAEDYGVFTVDAYEVVDDLRPDTIPDALMGAAPVE